MEDVIGNLIEALYSMFFILSDDYSGMLKCLEASNHRCAVLLEALFGMTNCRFRYFYVHELRNRGQEKSVVHTKLKAWKYAPYGLEGGPLERSKNLAEEVGKEALTDVIRARLCVKRSGG